MGDSLEVGSGPHLRAALAGLPVEIDAQTGRSSVGGVRVLAQELGPEHSVIVFPLGTNDSSANTFASSLAAVQQLAAGRCVVLATISRPPLRGAPARELNSVIAQFAAQGNFQVADWRAAAAVTPGALGRDRTHATGAGYALRASLLAEAVQGCLLGAGPSGIPAPEDPNAQPPPREQRRPEPREPPARPVRVPVQRSLLGLASVVRRAAAPVSGALEAMRDVLSGGAPEPVLGAP